MFRPVHRVSMFVVAVCLVTASSLIAATSVSAEESDCRGSWLCEIGRNPNHPEAPSVTDFSGAYDDITGWLNSIGNTLDDECNPTPGLSCADPKIGLVLTPGALSQVKTLGTAGEVKAGQALGANICANGSVCARALSALKFGNSPAGDLLRDWVDTGVDPKTGKVVDFGPGAYYPATVVSRGPYADLKYVVSGKDVEEPVKARNPIGLTDTDKVCPISTNATATTNVTVTWRASTVNKTTGEWLHRGGEQMWTVHGGVPEEGACLDPSGLGNHPSNEWELRSFDLVADRPGVSNELTNGYSWGQQFYPEGSQIRSTVRCLRSDGTEYEIAGEPTLLDFHLVRTPACSDGDNPLWQELDVIKPDGGVIPQSVENLRPTWDRSMLPAGNSPYPACADGSCLWIIKVGNTWCARGVAGCTDWAERPGEAKCFLGPYEMPLTRCGHLERVYENNPSTIPATKPNTDGDPATSEGPVVVRTPNPNATPAPTSTTTPRPVPTPTTTTPGPSPSPSTTTSTPPRTPPPVCQSVYGLGAVQPEAVEVANRVGQANGVTSIGGYRDPLTDKFGEHSSGLALDFMVPGDLARGDRTASYLIANADTLGVRWVIWKQRVYNVEKGGGWRQMEDRGSPTDNHMDHVHVLLNDRDGESVSCAGDPLGQPTSSCFPSGWSWNPVDWVFRPTVCALKMLFIPSDGWLDSAYTDVRDAFMNSPIGSWVAFVADIGTGFDLLAGGGDAGRFASLTSDNAVHHDSQVYDGARIAAIPMVQDPGGGGPDIGNVDYSGMPWAAPGGALCQGPALPTGFIGDKGILPQNIYPFAACEGVMAKVAATSRVILVAFLAYTVFWTTLQQIGAAFGYHISFRPAPSDDGSGGLASGHSVEVLGGGRK